MFANALTSRPRECADAGTGVFEEYVHLSFW
jgi:hypothetical protein